MIGQGKELQFYVVWSEKFKLSDEELKKVCEVKLQKK